MTPDRFRDGLTLLRWSQRGLADILECDDSMVRRWASSHAEIPVDQAGWLDTLARAHAAAPAPTTRRRRRRPASLVEA